MSEKRKPRRKSKAKELRNQQMVADAAAGKTVTQIAEKYGIARQTASKIMNSEETKIYLTLLNERAKLLLNDALDTLAHAMENRAEFGYQSVANKSATSLLKTYGIIKETVDITHQFPKPVVIKRSDGTEEILGTEEDLQKED